MSKMYRSLASGLAFLFTTCTSVWGGEPPASLDTWVDMCSVVATDPKIAKLADAECASIVSSAVVRRNATTYDILVEPRYRYRVLEFPSVVPPLICPNSKFYGEDRAIGDFPGRSGFLVGPDLVLTAAHGINSPNAAIPWTIVFGYSGRPIIPGHPACFYNHTAGISADDVYHAVQIVAYGPSIGGGIDLLLLRLDRPVVNRQPVRVRHEGQAEPGDRLVAVGHPDQLTTKVDLQGRFIGTQSERVLLTSGIHSFAGSSGSMIYNWDRDYVEGLVATGGAVTDVTTPEGCKFSVHLDGVHSIGPVITKAFSAFIPPFSMTVSPLAPVSHNGPVGGPTSNPSTTYWISPPSPSAPPPDFDVTVDPVWFKGSGLPLVTTKISTPGIAWNSPVKLNVGVSTAGVPQGRYVSTVRVRDRVTGFVDTLVHNISVGVTDFSVTPPEQFFAVQMAPPINATKQYTLKNLTLVPVDIEVRSGAPWITINGVEARDGSTITSRYSLTPIGTPGDQAILTAGISRRLEPGPVGTFESAITFDNLDPSPLALGDISIPVVFQWGRRSYTSETPVEEEEVPDGSPEGIVHKLHVTDLFCLANLSISVGPFGFVDTSELRITLTSPDGTSVVVSDREAFPAGLEGYTFSTQAMDTFLDRPAIGAWTLQIADVVPGGSTFKFSLWSLTATSYGAPPCQSAASD